MTPEWMERPPPGPTDTMASGVKSGLLATVAGQAVFVPLFGVLGRYLEDPLWMFLAALPGFTQFSYLTPLIVASELAMWRRRTLGLMTVGATVFGLNGLLCGVMIFTIDWRS